MKKILLILGLLFSFVAAQASVKSDLRNGGLFYKKQQYGQAINRYNRALEQAPGNQQAMFSAGTAYYQLKDYKNAEKMFTEAAEQDGAYKQDALFDLGNAYYRDNNAEKAIESFRKAIINNPKDKEAIHNLQIVLQNKDNPKGGGGNDENNPEDSSPNQNNQDNEQNQGNSTNQDQRQDSQQDGMPKDDADRVMQMAKENEQRARRMPAERQKGDNKIEKDW